MKKVKVHVHANNYKDLYLNYKGGTMFLNTIYDKLKNNPNNFQLVVIGCDMMYNREGDTFYSNIPGNKARNDPLLLWGEEGLNAELENSLLNYNKYGKSITNASTHESRLPYPRFVEHLT
jgi:hypothetical protein